MSEVATVDDYLQEAGSLELKQCCRWFCWLLRSASSAEPRIHPATRRPVVLCRLAGGQVTTLLQPMERRCMQVTSLLKAGICARLSATLSADFAQTFGPDCFDIEDEWSNYQQLGRFDDPTLARPTRSKSRSRGLWSTIKTRISILWR